jgi:hypothetical protein
MIQILSPSGTTQYPFPAIIDTILPPPLPKWTELYPKFQEYWRELGALCSYLQYREAASKHKKFNPRVVENALCLGDKDEIDSCEKLFSMMEEDGDLMRGERHQFILTAQGEELYHKISRALPDWTRIKKNQDTPIRYLFPKD